MDKLNKKFPGRKEQIEQLSSIFLGKSAEDYAPQSVFVYGPPSTGKTSLINELLKPNNAYVNCVECFTSRLLFEHSINQLMKHKPGFHNDYTSSRKIDNIQQFTNSLKELFPSNMKTKYLILDKAERLRDMQGTILSSLLRLSELTGKNICVIFISNIVFEKFRVKSGGMEPYLVRFPEYTKEDTIQILQLDFKPSTITFEKNQNTVDLDISFYTSFLELIYSIFCYNCKDLNELRYFAALLFPLYIKPIQEGSVGKKDTAKLFNLAKPYFSEATEKLYLREISSAEWSKESKQLMETDQLSTSNVGRAQFELPFYTKFLLIAAYLASYNPPKFDVRYFAKTSEERRKKKGGGTKKGRVDKLGGKMRQQLLGPKAFPVERMLAIFYSIVNGSLEDTVDIQLQITSLTTLRLLVRTTTIDRLDGAKYKCNVNFEFVKSVANSVNFVIEHYLYDFC